MMASQEFITRIQEKTDTSENWAKVESTFVPLYGELIIYSDLGRMKVGDGVTTLEALSWPLGIIGPTGPRGETGLKGPTGAQGSTGYMGAVNAATSKIYVSGVSFAGASTLYCNTSVYCSGSVLYGAAWNDYAEFRNTKEKIEPGRCVAENGDGTLSISTNRLIPGCDVVSDTFGYAIGKTDVATTPLAMTGRVLAYPYEDRDSYKPGDAVCSGPNGTISKMTRKEIINYPDRIIGTVSEIPTYDTWGAGNVSVNGRIWIRIR